MKLAFIAEDGRLTTYSNVGVGTVSLSGDEMTLEFEVRRQSNGDFGRTHVVQEVNDAAIDFFGLDAIKKGRRIPKSGIRKGDLIRMKDHGEPVPGERDYKTIEYVATEDGDAGYQHNPGEKFYLLERPKPTLPTAPGSVVKVRVPGYGVQHIVLGKDGLWRGPNMKAHASKVHETADVLEVIA